jgi:tetratricopeptide (TPR) repeat protein
LINSWDLLVVNFIIFNDTLIFMADWFRKKSWTEDDEKDFFLKLSRARKDGRAQYLKIQAIELAQTKNEKLLGVAEILINRLFTDYPDDRFNKPDSIHLLGDIYRLRNNFEKAIIYYKQALDFEMIYPQVKTQAYLDYSELIVKTNKVNLFNSVEDILLKRLPDQLFPIEKYKSFSILAIISNHRGDLNNAKHYTELADQYANKETSGLRYHKYLGVVKERDSWLDRLVKRK